MLHASNALHIEIYKIQIKRHSYHTQFTQFGAGKDIQFSFSYAHDVN